jgi:hypothetical protein
MICSRSSTRRDSATMTTMNERGCQQKRGELHEERERRHWAFWLRATCVSSISSALLSVMLPLHPTAAHRLVSYLASAASPSQTL